MFRSERKLFDFRIFIFLIFSSHSMCKIKQLPPPMAYVSIDHLLDIAAETVARLSCESGSSRQMRKNLRVSGGHGGRRYLWALHNTVEDVRETGIQDEDQVCF